MIDGYELPVLVHFRATFNIPLRPDSFATTKLVNYGDELEIDEQIAQALTDRNGRVQLLDLLDDEGQQVRRFGRRVLGRGPWPADEPRYEPGSHQEDDARLRALAEADALPSEDERRIARAKVRERFGMPSSARSRTIATYTGDR